MESIPNNSLFTSKVIFGALDESLLILGAFIFYNMIHYYKEDIFRFIPMGKKYYQYVFLLFHLIFIFLFDLFLLYLFTFIL